MAERLGLRERRVRECMLFRLSSGAVMQLFGLRKGFCFVCEGRLFTPETPEPVCLRCLNAIERVLEERFGKSRPAPSGQRGRFVTGEHTGAEFRVMRVDEASEQLPPSCPRPEDLPDDVGVLKEELSKCRQTVSEYEHKTGLRLEIVNTSPEPEQKPESEAAKPAEASPAEIQIPKVGAPGLNKEGRTVRAEEENLKKEQAVIMPDDQEFLAMLELDETSIPAPEVNMPDPVAAGEPLRHYGFKRHKKKEA